MLIKKLHGFNSKTTVCTLHDTIMNKPEIPDINYINWTLISFQLGRTIYGIIF